MFRAIWMKFDMWRLFFRHDNGLVVS